MSITQLLRRVSNPQTVTEGGSVIMTGHGGGGIFTASLPEQLAMAGRVFLVSDADENDRVTGQTSFAATTPTFLLDVPAGSAAMPLWLKLAQDGTVAGDFITVDVSVDSAVRRASGGTAEAMTATRSALGVATACVFYSGATAAAATAARTIYVKKLAEDVDLGTADANSFNYGVDLSFPRDFPGLILTGPASLLVFTYAGTTGPTWEWSFAFADVPLGWL